MEVAGVPILFRLFRRLADRGVNRIIIATGYKDEKIRRAVGNSRDGIDVDYVFNHDWSSTNNIVSLYRASKKIETDFLLVESDLVLGKKAFDRIDGGNSIVVDRLKPGMNGTAVSLDRSGRVGKFIFHPDGSTERELFKTVNIYSLELSDYRAYVLPMLKRSIIAGHTGIFYEYAFSDAVSETDFSLTPVFFNEKDWVEIDTPEDLALAERRFGGPASVPE